MELRQLRYFLTVVDEGQITRAATKLFITQAALSQHVQRLERDLGTALFVRAGSRLTLTPSGEIVDAQAREIVQLCDRLEEAVSLAAQGSAGTVRIGYWPGAGPARLTMIAETLRDRGGDVTVTFRSGDPTDLTRAVSQRDLDAAIVDRAAVPADFEHVRVSCDELVLATTAGHRLTSFARPNIRWLADEPFVVVDRTHAAGLYDAVIAACQRSGFSPRIAAQASSLDDAALMVAAGRGVALLPQPHAERWDASGLTVMSLVDRPTIETVMCWHPSTMNETLGECVRLATAHHLDSPDVAAQSPGLNTAVAWVAAAMRLRLAIGAERVSYRCVTETAIAGLGEEHVGRLLGGDPRMVIAAMRHETDCALAEAAAVDPALRSQTAWLKSTLHDVRRNVDSGQAPSTVDDGAMQLDTFAISRFMAAAARVGSWARIVGHRALDYYPAASAAYVAASQALINEVELVARAVFPSVHPLRELNSSTAKDDVAAQTSELLQTLRAALPVALLEPWDALNDHPDVVAFERARGETAASGLATTALVVAGLRAFGVRAEFGRELAAYPRRVVDQLALNGNGAVVASWSAAPGLPADDR
jgi:DNA-binding transcriptional LysR family regulator